jgi:uncharacterized protein
MRLLVLDTNVVISAGISQEGAPPKLLLDSALDGHVQVVTCPTIIDEYREVVQRRKFAAYGFPPPWLEYLIDASFLLPEPAAWPLALPDPKDAVFLALAHASGAWLVTGNIKHFPERARRGVTVISPADYLAHLKRSGE